MKKTAPSSPLDSSAEISEVLRSASARRHSLISTQAGLRALAPAEATRGSIIAGKKKDFLRVKVPTKPLGFLAASTVERDPAWPEAHRSAVAAAVPFVPKDKAV